MRNSHSARVRIMSLEEPWGQLVSTENPPGTEEERVPVLGNAFLIGRGKDAELVISGNQFVSTHHCLLQREEGCKWITDTSTNGTLLNGKKLEKHKKVKLTDGDVIGIVVRRDRLDCNVLYKFQDLCPTSEPQPTDSEDDCTLDLTQQLEHTPEEKEATGEGTSVKGIASKKRAKERDETESEGSPSAKRLSLAPEKRDSAADTLNTEKEVLEEASKSCKTEPLAKSTLLKTDSIEQTLICQICQEIFHNCVSLQPCMHCYCAGCYSEWMEKSNKCPSCRNKVERISKNHLVQNLVDAFLRANPGKKRPEEDMKELDEKNKITRDMLYPKRPMGQTEFDDDSDGGSSGSDSSPSPTQRATGWRTLYSAPHPGYVCRQCPAFTGYNRPSHPPPPPFTCSPSTNHILCQCCMQPMPDRRMETGVAIPPQKCDLCWQAFCHMYWGCQCSSGCLGQFQAMEFRDAVLATLISDNEFETRILKDYLDSQHKTIKDMLHECLAKLESGEYTCTADSRISSSSHTCAHCALKNFKVLAYQYRAHLSNDDLPASVTQRPNCHWGKNCRTQKHNGDHARRYNHICEQSRFS